MTTSENAGDGASESVTTTDEQGLLMERVFDAPRELVWSAWTEPEHFARWYGPHGFTIPTCEMDFRVGGAYSLVMRAPNGFEMANHGVYKEIVPLERFVASMAADVHDETTLTVTLEELSDGRTKMTMRQAGWPSAEMAEGAGGGWGQAFEKLAVELAAA